MNRQIPFIYTPERYLEKENKRDYKNKSTGIQGETFVNALTMGEND